MSKDRSIGSNTGDELPPMRDRERRLQELRADIAVGLEQIERGEVIEFTPELLEELVREAEENMRLGKPVRSAVRP
ncbi:MAG TPA: hypothetical protein VFL82_16460 [Thermomicrobiales bacterium]|nr:hypothetical protein [Thermomicrobiales bacterium]